MEIKIELWMMGVLLAAMALMGWAGFDLWQNKKDNQKDKPKQNGNKANGKSISNKKPES